MASGTSLRIQAYNLIKDKIINCEYKPGVMITEEKLIAELKLTRTPIRDALGRLEQEGLLSIKPKKGILITPISIEEATYLLEARMMYELYAIREYGKLMDDKALLECYREIKEVMKHPVKAASDPVDAKLHEMIIAANPNTFIRASYEMASNQIRRLRIRLRILTGVTSHRMATSHEEHLRIVAACIKKDWIEAEEALRIHLKHSNDVVFDLLLTHLPITKDGSR